MNNLTQIAIMIVALVFAILLIVKPTKENRQKVKYLTRIIGYIFAVGVALFAGYWVLWLIFKIIHHLWYVTA